MNFLKRASASVTRRPGKTIILLLLVFILGIIISGAISVQQAIENTEDNLRRNLPAVATVEQDWEAAMAHEAMTGEWMQMEALTADLIRQIGELPYIESFDFSISGQVFSSELERFVHPNPDFEHVIWTPDIEDLVQLELQGVQNHEMLDIQAGIIELVTGRVFTEQEISNFNNINSVAIISQEFAELNNLTVGSTFIVDNTVYDEFNVTGNWIESEIFVEDNVVGRESYELEVIGIFRSMIESTGGDDWENARREIMLGNRIYVPNAMTERSLEFRLEQMLLTGIWDDGEWEPTLEDWLWFDPIFRLNDPRDLTAFSEAAGELLPEFWRTTDLSNTFSDISTSMENMQWLASLILWISISATLLILSLLITLFLRDRKYEIGIYLALGEKKMKVIMQIVLEVVSVAVVAISLALFAGNFLARNISESMIQQDLIASQQDQWSNSMVWTQGSERLSWFSSGNMSIEEMMESYQISLDMGTIGLFYAIGIGTILISTIVPIAYIIRLDPKKIMM